MSSYSLLMKNAIFSSRPCDRDGLVNEKRYYSGSYSKKILILIFFFACVCTLAVNSFHFSRHMFLFNHFSFKKFEKIYSLYIFTKWWIFDMSKKWLWHHVMFENIKTFCGIMYDLKEIALKILEAPHPSFFQLLIYWRATSAKHLPW